MPQPHWSQKELNIFSELCALEHDLEEIQNDILLMQMQESQIDFSTCISVKLTNISEDYTI